MPRRVLATIGLVLGLATAGCGLAGVGGDPTTSPRVDETATDGDAPGETTTDGDVPGETATTTVDDDPTAKETGATESDIPDDQSDAADPIPDAQTVEFLRRGLWNVPETQTRCGWEGAFGREPGTMFARYQDASDDGDFFLVCLTSTVEPSWPITLRITDPTGAPAGLARVRASGEAEEVSGFTTELLVATTADGVARYNGLTIVEDGVRVTQVHLWLPHARRTGTWLVRLGDATAPLDVAAPCASGDPVAHDPLVWPLDIDFARNGFGEDIDRHCLAWPDAVGLPLAEGQAAMVGVLQRRGQSGDELTIDRVCGDAPPDTVVGQQPQAHSIQPDEFLPDPNLLVSDGPCPSPSDRSSGEQGTSTPPLPSEPADTTASDPTGGIAAPSPASEEAPS